MFLKIIVFVFLNFCFIAAQQDVGDKCTVARTGANGTCRLVRNCRAVIDDIRNRRPHTVCGYSGRQQIVCCPDPATAKPVVITNLQSSDRISARKCSEYKEAVYEKVYISTSIGEKPIERKVSKCGFVSVPLIVGGTEAKPREFPHMTLIGYDSGNTIHWGCGGSLISNEYVLTAGHCLDSRDFGVAKYVKIGDHNLNVTDEDAQPIDLRVVQRIPYTTYKSSSNYNDIALLRLERQIEFNRYIRPACLPEESAVNTRTAIASGWGQVEWSGNPSSILLKVVLELFSNQECNETFKYDINRRLRYGIMEDTQICAGSHTEEKDTCQGDSGGPLQIYHSNHFCMYTVVGVTSFGKACGLVGSPGVYTRVYSYLSWIEGIVWPNQ